MPKSENEEEESADSKKNLPPQANFEEYTYKSATTG